MDKFTKFHVQRNRLNYKVSSEEEDLDGYATACLEETLGKLNVAHTYWHDSATLAGYITKPYLDTTKQFENEFREIMKSFDFPNMATYEEAMADIISRWEVGSGRVIVRLKESYLMIEFRITKDLD